MSEIALFLFASMLVILIISNFICQIYVATKVFEGFQVIRGIVRGNRTFIHGWKRANELGIKDIMVFWSIVVASLVLIICTGAAMIANTPPSSL